MFAKAVRQQRKLRLALAGPTGAGKTFTALAIAKGLGGRVALIDSERHSASLYATRFDFDTADLSGGHPDDYTRLIEGAAAAGYDVLIIDSFSHAWAGEAGILAQKDKATKRNRGGNDFTAWRDVTPMHDRLVRTVLEYPGHVIVTMRAKMAYALTEGNGGKAKVEKLGMAPVQREGVEYEFDVVVDLDQAHTGVVSKTRADFLDNAVIDKPGEKLGRDLAAWLGAGAPAPVAASYAPPRLVESPPAAPPPPEAAATEEPTPASASAPKIPTAKLQTAHAFAWSRLVAELGVDGAESLWAREGLPGARGAVAEKARAYPRYQELVESCRARACLRAVNKVRDLRKDPPLELPELGDPAGAEVAKSAWAALGELADIEVSVCGEHRGPERSGQTSFAIDDGVPLTAARVEAWIAASCAPFGHRMVGPATRAPDTRTVWTYVQNKD